MSLILNLFEDAVAEASARASHALVLVGGQRGFGAGAIVHADGLIVTNAHVVHDRQPRVQLEDGREFTARLLAHHSDLDLAALSIDAKNLPTFELGDSRLIRAGELVIALGHPFGVAGVAVAGIAVGVGPDERRPGRDWLAVDLPLRPGHSGGPIIDAEGRLIGINTMMAGLDIGLAIPVDAVKAFLKAALDERVAASVAGGGGL